MKRKICVYVGEELVTRLAAAAEQRGATKSGLVGAALDRFLDVAGDQDDRPGMDERLAQMGQQLDQLTRELKFVGETVAMHARYHLTVTPALPDAAQSAACRTGAARFNEFVTQVARRVDQEKPLILETLDRLAATNAHRFSSADRAPQSAACERVHHADRASTNSCWIAAQVAAVPISSAPPTYPADSEPVGVETTWSRCPRLRRRRRFPHPLWLAGMQRSLSSGRFALIDDGLGFSLVPWSPSLEKQLGRHLASATAVFWGVRYCCGFNPRASNAGSIPPAHHAAARC